MELAQQYTSVDEAAEKILVLGSGALLFKLDIKSAYRTVPVHPEDRGLLAMSWEGCWYIDTMLPFGLRSAPKIFYALADALEWVLSQRGIESVLHYLDDFLILGPPELVRCQQALDLAMSTCGEVGFPLALDEGGGPRYGSALRGH